MPVPRGGFDVRRYTSAIRIGHRQRPQQHRVHHAEDRRVRADAKRQRQNRRERQIRGSAQRANPESQIAQQLVQPHPAARM